MSGQYRTLGFGKLVRIDRISESEPMAALELAKRSARRDSPNPASRHLTHKSERFCTVPPKQVSESIGWFRGAEVARSPNSIADNLEADNLEKEMHMSFGLYAVGFAIMVVGLIYGAHLMHMPTHWIVVGAIVLLGVGILSGVKATRQKDPSE